MTNIITIDGERLEYDNANYALNLFFTLRERMDGLEDGESTTIAFRVYPGDRLSPVDVVRIRRNSSLRLHLDPEGPERKGSVANLMDGLDSQVVRLMTDWESGFRDRS